MEVCGRGDGHGGSGDAHRALTGGDCRSAGQGDRLVREGVAHRLGHVRTDGLAVAGLQVDRGRGHEGLVGGADPDGQGGAHRRVDAVGDRDRDGARGALSGLVESLVISVLMRNSFVLSLVKSGWYLDTLIPMSGRVVSVERERLTLYSVVT